MYIIETNGENLAALIAFLGTITVMIVSLCVEKWDKDGFK